MYLLQCCARPMIRSWTAHSADSAPLHGGENGLASCPAPESVCPPQWPRWGSGCGRVKKASVTERVISNTDPRTHTCTHARIHSYMELGAGTYDQTLHGSACSRVEVGVGAVNFWGLYPSFHGVTQRDLTVHHLLAAIARFRYGEHEIRSQGAIIADTTLRYPVTYYFRAARWTPWHPACCARWPVNVGLAISGQWAQHPVLAGGIKVLVRFVLSASLVSRACASSAPYADVQKSVHTN